MGSSVQQDIGAMIDGVTGMVAKAPALIVAGGAGDNVLRVGSIIDRQSFYSCVVTSGGTWSDNGTLRSGIAEDQTVIAATSIVDFGPRQRGKEIAVITGVKWDTLTSP